MYVCMYAYVCVCMHACVHMCVYACMHACMHVCMYVIDGRNTERIRPRRRFWDVVVQRWVMRTDLSDWYGVKGGCISAGTGRQKVHGTAVICTFCRSAQHQMRRFDPTWPQHRPDLGSNSARKAPTSAQLGSKMAQLCSEMAQLGSNSAQVEVRMASKWGT